MTRAGLAVLAAAACLSALAPAPASGSVLGKACNLAGGVAGKACDLASSPGKVLSAGKNLITGHLGSALKDLLGGGGSAASTASTALALAAVVTWAVGGAKFALDETAKVLTHTTRPNLRSTWFSGAYWRMAGIAALLTLPFLFAAAMQALMRSDLGLLAQAALGYLPLAMLSVSIAAPVVMLLLAATDQLCALVSSGAAGDGARFLSGAGKVFGIAHFAAAPFITFLLAVITTGGALVLWLELAVREAAVYVIVLMLPLTFAALVWPARRVWAIRSVELLVALILSKFAIVAVLGLAGAALGHVSGGGLTTALAGAVLVLLAAFAPWAVLRLVPLSELAAGAMTTLRPELAGVLHHQERGDGPARKAPPEQQSEIEQSAGADSIREQLHDLQSASPGHVRSERRHLEERRHDHGETAASGPGEDRGAAPVPSERRPAVLSPLGGPTEAPLGGPTEPSFSAADASAEPRAEPPRLTLGPSSFTHGKWSEPGFDVLSGEPGERRDPLPPTQDEEVL
jgi:hypothetical protein